MRREASGTRPGRGEGGFSLVELAMALSILSVLSTLALGGYAVLKMRAQEALLKNLVYLVKVETDTWVHDYDSDHTWGGNYDSDFLNGRLESTLEAGSRQRSIVGARNPFSGSSTVINWTDVLLAESNPAIQLTNNDGYSYEGIGAVSVHPELRGTVVVYLDNNVATVDIYYVDLLGKRSKMLLTSRAEGGTSTSVTPTQTATPATTTTTTTTTTTETPATTTTAATPATTTPSATPETPVLADREKAEEAARKKAEKAREKAEKAREKEDEAREKEDEARKKSEEAAKKKNKEKGR